MKSFTETLNENKSLGRPELLKRAKKIDEQFVLSVLQGSHEKSWKNLRLGNPDEDFNHMDIVGTNSAGQEIHFDVKRNSPENASSPNFTFTAISNTGKIYNLDDKNGYVIFIDDVNKELYVAPKTQLKELIKNLTSHKSKYNKSEYYLIRKVDIKRISTHIEVSENVKSMLK